MSTDTTIVERNKQYFLTTDLIKKVLNKDLEKSSDELMNELYLKFKGNKYQFKLIDLKSHYELTEDEYNKAYDKMAIIYKERAEKAKITRTTNSKVKAKKENKSSINAIKLQTKIDLLLEDIKEKNNQLSKLITELNKLK